MNSKVMKVKYLLLSLMGAMALSASAQDAMITENQPVLPARKTVFGSSAGHWFITLQGGVNSQFLSGNEEKPLMDRLHVMPTLSLGKWHNPYFATRLQLMAGPTPNFYKAGGEVKKFDAAMVAGHFDFMFDMVNYFAPYNAKRVFHFTPFIGLGTAFKYVNGFAKAEDYVKFGEPHRYALTGNTGVQMSFRLAKRLDLVLEAQAMYSNINLTKEIMGGKRDASYVPAGSWNGLLGVVTAGLNFNLGATEWETITPMDWNLINDLNGQINKLRAENKELAKRPVSCPECPEVVAPVEEVKTMVGLGEKAVMFGFDSAKIAPRQEVVLFEIAKFVKDNNQAIVVVGYADKTGNTNYNLNLSERRAKAVANELINTYGVPSDMISVEWQGESEQFETRAWNRVVIVRAK